ncbi:type 1 glutamine amidotransferase [Halomarina salina]|uniref:Type 1 glutamine amidotransferase n=1 Tax=Halomarina salina TaxID=1872699 RepID=A0ABD5RNK4_9EURY|nr:type 1 glutamine amidotransferase [Halomarina salina]
MERPRLALLNAARSGESTRRNFRRELDADLAEFSVVDGQLPPESPADGQIPYDGVVVTGSRSSTYDDEQWIDDACEWVRAAHDRGLPILGVCFGHQLLARALGGTVEAMGARDTDAGFEIGYRTVERTAETPLLAGLNDEFTVFTTHGDTVSELPDGASVFAENEYGVHGFRVGDAFGVQFHPEYDQETAREVTRGKEFLGEERIEHVLSGITQENYASACEAKRLFDNFTDHVDAVRAEPAAD